MSRPPGAPTCRIHCQSQVVFSPVRFIPLATLQGPRPHRRHLLHKPPRLRHSLCCRVQLQNRYFRTFGESSREPTVANREPYVSGGSRAIRKVPWTPLASSRRVQTGCLSWTRAGGAHGSLSKQWATRGSIRGLSGSRKFETCPDSGAKSSEGILFCEYLLQRPQRCGKRLCRDHS